jgi:hypothetical protein
MKEEPIVLGRAAKLQRLWDRDPPLVVEVAGKSMMPSLELGWKVRVEPITGDIAPGDIILIDNGGPRTILHRALHVFERDGIPVVIQRGDAGGPLTVTPLQNVVGRAVAILSPAHIPFPTAGRLQAATRSRFLRVQRAARSYVRLRRRFPAMRRILDRGLSLRGKRFLELQTIVSLELDLARTPSSTRHSNFQVRELRREEVVSLLSRSRLPPQTPEEIDNITRGRWRCFVAFLEVEPVHISFVEMRAEAPHLFRVWTIPSERRKGVFAEVARTIASRLATEGHSRLTSSASGRNAALLAAHRAAGFAESRRRIEARIFGIRLERILSRVLRLRPRDRGSAPSTAGSTDSRPSEKPGPTR